MITIKHLSSVVNDNVLQELYIRRKDETILMVSKEDRKNLDTLYRRQKNQGKYYPII